MSASPDDLHRLLRGSGPDPFDAPEEPKRSRKRDAGEDAVPPSSPAAATERAPAVSTAPTPRGPALGFAAAVAMLLLVAGGLRFVAWQEQGFATARPVLAETTAPTRAERSDHGAPGSLRDEGRKAPGDGSASMNAAARRDGAAAPRRRPAAEADPRRGGTAMTGDLDPDAALSALRALGGDKIESALAAAGLDASTTTAGAAPRDARRTAPTNRRGGRHDPSATSLAPGAISPDLTALAALAGGGDGAGILGLLGGGAAEPVVVDRDPVIEALAAALAETSDEIAVATRIGIGVLGIAATIALATLLVGRLGGIASGLLAIACGPWLLAELTALDAALLMVLLPATGFLLVRAWSGEGAWGWLFAGASVGLLGATSSAAAPLALPLLLVVRFSRRRAGDRLSAATPFALGLTLGFAPALSSMLDALTAPLAGGGGAAATLAALRGVVGGGSEVAATSAVERLASLLVPAETPLLGSLPALLPIDLMMLAGLAVAGVVPSWRGGRALLPTLLLLGVLLRVAAAPGATALGVALPTLLAPLGGAALGGLLLLGGAKRPRRLLPAALAVAALAVGTRFIDLRPFATADAATVANRLAPRENAAALRGDWVGAARAVETALAALPPAPEGDRAANSRRAVAERTLRLRHAWYLERAGIADAGD